MTVNHTLILQTMQSEPFGNGIPGLQAYDAPEAESPDRFIIRWHDFTVFETNN